MWNARRTWHARCVESLPTGRSKFTRARYRLLPEMLYLAVNIIDLFLSARVVSLARPQLVGITCMFLAAKVEEIVVPSAPTSFTAPTLRTQRPRSFKQRNTSSRRSSGTWATVHVPRNLVHVAFTPYHPLPPTEVPPVLQLFFMFIVHCYRLLHSAVRFLAKRPALFLCQSTRPSAVCICIYSFTPLSYHFPAIHASH